MVSKALQALKLRESIAWRPQPWLSTPDWCHEHVRLPAETSSSPGRYDLRRFPFWRGVLEACDDPAVETITIQASTQLGKTTLMQAVLASRPSISPAPAILAAPDRDACRELRDKFYRMAEATPIVAHRLPPEWRRNDQWIDFGNMLCHLAWSGSRQRLSGKSCKYVFCTEIDRWRQSPKEGATQRLISERVKGFHRFLIIYESTPTDEGSSIADLYDASDQRHYLVPCPRCGFFQELRFFLHKEGPHAGCGGVGGLQDETGKWVTPDEARQNAYYICEKGCRIESHEKLGMITRGVWVAKGQSIDAKGRIVGKPEQSQRNAGFQISSLYAETCDFGRIAATYLESREDQSSLQSFWNNWLALRWTTKTKSPKWQRIGRRLSTWHKRGVVPAAAFFLTAGIDTQDACAYWVVRAWGEGSTSWLVDWGKVSMRLNSDGKPIPASDLDQLDDLVLDRVFPLAQANPAGATQLRVRLANIDYQGHRTWEVSQWARERALQGPERLRVIAGDTRVSPGEFYRLTIVEKHAGTGMKYPGGLKRWAIDVDTYKDDVQSRFEAALDAPGAWMLPEKILEDGGDYLRQICNEGKRSTKNRSGKEVTAWVVIDERTGNHYWDCEIYARAAADMVTGQDWIDLARRAGPPKPAKKRPRSAAASPAGQASPYGRGRE